MPATPSHATRLLTITCLGMLLAAQLPDSPTGRRGNALIEIIRHGTEIVDAAFVDEHFAPAYPRPGSGEERTESVRGILEDLPSVELEGVRKTGPWSATLFGRASSGERIEIAYELEESEPHRIAALMVERAAALPAMSPAELAAAADRHLAERAGRDEFSGVALIARSGEILFEKAYGLASRRYDVVNRVDTPFNLGSIDKIFTKIAVAQLAAAGELGLDDTIAAHLPDYPNPQVAEAVTLQQLATHTSGLGDIFTDDFRSSSKKRFQRPADFFELFAAEPLLFEPGTRDEYSNAGYIVLGAIIEAVSGETYHDYVRRHIFEPAGMTSTHAWDLDDAAAEFATGYTRWGPGHEPVPLHENTFHIPYRGTPAGGGFSTVRDLLAFRDAFFDHVLLDPRYSEWVASNELPDEAPPDPGYALGLAGGGPGVNATLEIDPEWTIIVLANLDPPVAGEAAAHLQELARAVVPVSG